MSFFNKEKRTASVLRERATIATALRAATRNFFAVLLNQVRAPKQATRVKTVQRMASGERMMRSYLNRYESPPIRNLKKRRKAGEA